KLHRQIARLAGSVRRLHQAASKKFGKEGVQILRNRLEVQAAQLDLQRIDDYLKAEVIVFEQKGVDTGFALLKEREEQFWRLRRRGSRWYLTMSESEVALMARSGGAVPPELRKGVEKAIKLVEQSKRYVAFLYELDRLQPAKRPRVKFRYEVGKSSLEGRL